MLLPPFDSADSDLQGVVNQARILVVDKDVPGASGPTPVFMALQAEGYSVEIAAGATDALHRILLNPPALVLLHAEPTRTQWIELCRHIQAMANLPIIIGFRLHSQIDAVVAFELGVAGYISDPTRLHELVARVRVALRLNGGPTIPEPSNTPQEASGTPGDLFVSGPLSVNFASREVTRDVQPLRLPRLEFDLLAFLLSPPGQVRTREEIIGRLWNGRRNADSRTLDTHMKRLRQKLEIDPATPRHLITVRGVGFRFDA
jgi:two-component system response regulator RegX3